MLGGGAAGSVVSVFDINSIWLVGMVGIFVLILVTSISLREFSAPDEDGEGSQKPRSQIKQLLLNKNIIVLFLISFVLFFYNQPNFLYWQVYFKKLG